MCCFCLNVEGLACCLNVIVSYKVRNYVWSWIAANNQASTRKSQWVCVIHSWTSNNFSEISFDKVSSSMKHYDNLIELKTLYSKKSGIVHYFRTYIVLEVGFYLCEMRAVGFVERVFTKDAVWLHGVWKLNFIFALLWCSKQVDLCDF